MNNVEIFRQSELTAQDVLDIAADHVVVATGAKWRGDRYTGDRYQPIEVAGGMRILTPDDIMDGSMPEGPTLIYDGDQFYMASILAEHIRSTGNPVHIVTGSDKLAPWSDNTVERWRAQARLIELGVEITTSHTLGSSNGQAAVLRCVYTGQEKTVPAQSIVMVSQRRPVDGLYHDISKEIASDAKGAPRTLAKIGDCDAPAIIAAAVYAGHRYAQELDQPDEEKRVWHDRVMFNDE